MVKGMAEYIPMVGASLVGLDHRDILVIPVLSDNHCSKFVSRSCCPPSEEPISCLLSHRNTTIKCNGSLNIEV